MVVRVFYLLVQYWHHKPGNQALLMHGAAGERPGWCMCMVPRALLHFHRFRFRFRYVLHLFAAKYSHWDMDGACGARDIVAYPIHILMHLLRWASSVWGALLFVQQLVMHPDCDAENSVQPLPNVGGDGCWMNFIMTVTCSGGRYDY
jgi:hypothetical protein